MNITLSRLVLKNFKGIRDFTADFSRMTEVYGDNATGKTTLFDAFSWLLFDKDSQNKKDFDIKTLDSNNNVIHGLNHEVEGTLLVDGKPLTFRKVYTEKWTKKRSSATSEFTGHTTDYYIDGVPVKLKEYVEYISSLIDEQVFKLLTNPTYFNEQLDWKKRRQTLLDVAGTISDAEVIASNRDLTDLPSILQGRSIDDHRKVIAARRAEINKELEKIPVRIDEARRSKPEADGLDEPWIDTEILGLRTTIEQHSAEAVKVQNGVQISELERRLREIDSEILEIKNRAKQSAMAVSASQERTVYDIQSHIYRLQDDVNRVQMQRSGFASAISDKKDEANRLREQWVEVNSQEPHIHVDDSCPTCGQSLPEDQVKQTHDKAFANFNREKSERLERIASQGKAAMEDVARLEAEVAKDDAYITELSVSIESETTKLEAARAELERLKSCASTSEMDTQINEKLVEHERVSGQLLALRESSTESLKNIQAGITALRNQLQQREQDKAKFAQARMIDQRIDELKQQERALAAEFERLERELYLTEEFIRCKVELLESRINSKFKWARFKLFEEQINGGLAETCETLYQGVPYSTGLNNAARINVGLDIINTLSAHYGITAPIFIDNRESVTQLIDVHSQVISLIVSEKDKKLRIDSSSEQVREAV